jgi:AcrR family transcriptional regulator
MARRYRLKARAARQEVTRQRIVEAAVHLHSTVGPAQTTLTAVAEHAGVSRPTLYSYFPDTATLFAACIAHGMAADPLPDPTAWLTIDPPEQRLRTALRELYAYYRRNEVLTANLVRDFEASPELRRFAEPMRTTMRAMRDALVAAWGRSGRRVVLLAALEHALDFRAWHSLVQSQKLSDEEAVDLMSALVERAAIVPRPGRVH